MRVRTNIGGAICVLYLTEGRDPSYIDARRDVRRPGFSFIEVVVAGHVRHTEMARDEAAPARIIGIMRAWVRGGLDACLRIWQAEAALFEGVDKR